jgi:hypothetical protein
VYFCQHILYEYLRAKDGYKPKLPHDVALRSGVQPRQKSLSTLQSQVRPMAPDDPAERTPIFA